MTITGKANFTYTTKEWQKIEKLASEKGKTFFSSQKAKEYLKSL